MNSTVSEGIGYGMIIAVYMNDQSLFDDLWRYEQAHTWTYTAMGQPSAATSLMNWYIASDGTVATQSDGGSSGSRSRDRCGRRHGLGAHHGGSSMERRARKL